MDYFDFPAGLTMTSKKFHRLFGGPPRKSEATFTQKDMDLARSIQDVTERVLLRIVRHIKKATGQNYLCLAGGVALNCVANSKLLQSKLFDDIWVQPASGDAGGALGAALFAFYHYMGNGRPADGKTDSMKGAYLGPEYSNKEIVAYLKENGIPFEELPRGELAHRVADLIAGHNVIGLFHGRMEYGPRALGNRSIIGDARSAQMQRLINEKIKFRESFRPFAPSVLAEKAPDYFELDRESPYMLLTARVRKELRRETTKEEQTLVGIDKLNIVRSSIPAVTHVDYSARVQTVSKEGNARYYDIIASFEKRHGCAVIVNTSFNVRGEPIVCSPRDAYRCFMRTNMDYLVMENCIIGKAEQPSSHMHKSSECFMSN